MTEKTRGTYPSGDKESRSWAKFGGHFPEDQAKMGGIGQFY